MRFSGCTGAVLLAGAIAACGGSKTDASPGAIGVGERASAAHPDSTTPATAATSRRRTVLFLGTSLTAGLGLDADSAYPIQLQRRIDSAGLAFRTVNAGVSGETSAGLLRRLDWVLQQPAAVIVIETGANDGLRGQSVAATKATIGQVIDRIRRDRPESRIVLVQMEAPPNFGREYAGAFHAMYPALAKEKGVVLLPFLLDRVAGFPQLNQADGIHPNYVGERLVTENVWKGLKPVLTARLDPTPSSR